MVAHLRSLLLLLFLFCCIQCRSNQVPSEVIVSEREMNHQSGVHVVVTSCQYHGYSYDLSKGTLFYMLSVKGKIIIPQSHAHLGTLNSESGKVIVVAVPSTGELSLDAVDEYMEGTEYMPEKIHWRKDTMIYCTGFDGDEDQNIDCILSKDDHAKLSKGEYIICLVYRRAKDQSYYSLYDRNYAVGTIAVRDSRMDFSRLKNVLQSENIKIEDQDISGKNKSLNFKLKIHDSIIIPDHSKISFIVDTGKSSGDRDSNTIGEFLKFRTFGRMNPSNTSVYVVPAQFEQGEITAHWYPEVHLSGGIDVYLCIANQDGYVYYPLVFRHNITYTVEKTISLNESSNVEITICSLIETSNSSPLLQWMRVDTNVHIDNAPQDSSVYILLAKDTTKDVKTHFNEGGQSTSSDDMDWYILKQEATSHYIVLDSDVKVKSAREFSQYQVFIVKEDGLKKKVSWISDYKTLATRKDDKHLLESVGHGDEYQSDKIIAYKQNLHEGANHVEQLYGQYIEVMKEMFACFRDQIGFVAYINNKVQNTDYQYLVMSDVKKNLQEKGTEHGSGRRDSPILLIRYGDKDQIPTKLFNWINNVHAQLHVDDVFAFLRVWRFDQHGSFISLGQGLGCRILTFKR